MASALTNFVSVTIDADDTLTVTGRNNDPVTGIRVAPDPGTAFKLAVILVSDDTKRCEPVVDPKVAESSPWHGTAPAGHPFHDGDHVYVVGLAKRPANGPLPPNGTDHLWAQEVCINERDPNL